MKQLICKQCNKEFKFIRKKKFCSSYCKEKSSREKRVLLQREYYKKWYAKNGRNRSDDYSDVISEWKEKNPEKVLARYLLRQAIRKKEIIKPNTCKICGNISRISGHHKDYSKPLEVIWCCSSCHKLIHSGRISI